MIFDGKPNGRLLSVIRSVRLDMFWMERCLETGGMHFGKASRPSQDVMILQNYNLGWLKYKMTFEDYVVCWEIMF